MSGTSICSLICGTSQIEGILQKNLKSQLIVLGWFAHRDIIGGLRLPFSDVFVGLILYWVQIKTQMQLHNVFSVPLALVDSIVCTYFPLFCRIYGLLDMQNMQVLWYVCICFTPLHIFCAFYCSKMPTVQLCFAHL